MFKDLSPNLKISITRSITQTFEQYMSDIGWSEERFSIEDYMVSWQEYITTKALWYTNIPDSMKHDPDFMKILPFESMKSLHEFFKNHHPKNKLQPFK